jgi:phosphoribosylformylglycinamidine cyclo-ligase
MGHRMEICLPEKFAESIISISKEFNVDAKIIGHIEASETRQLTINSPDSKFHY